MNSFFAQIVIVVALVVVAVIFSAVVDSAVCLLNPCTSNTTNPCVTASKGTVWEHCAGSCDGPAGCACQRPNTTVNCSCYKQQ